MFRQIPKVAAEKKCNHTSLRCTYVHNTTTFLVPVGNGKSNVLYILQTITLCCPGGFVVHEDCLVFSELQVEYYTEKNLSGYKLFRGTQAIIIQLQH